MVGVIFKRIQYHLAACVYGGRLVFRFCFLCIPVPLISLVAQPGC